MTTAPDTTDCGYGESPRDVKGKVSPSLSIERKFPDRVTIRDLNDNDVLQGRGSGSMQNTGNIRFRTLVEDLRPAYVSTASRKEKAKMINDLVRLIQSRNGRFLQRLGDGDSDRLGNSSSVDRQDDQEQFAEMTNEEAAEKTKQAIRYVHYKKVPLEEERRRKRVADSLPSQGGSTFFSNSVREKECTKGLKYTDDAKAATNIPPVVFPIFPNAANATSHAPVSRMNPLASQLQQTDLGQLLVTLQNSQIGIANRAPISSLQHQVGQQVQVVNGNVQLLSNLDQNPNAISQLGSASSLFQNNDNNNNDLSQKAAHASALLISAASNSNPSSQQLPQQQQLQQAQLNILLQSLLQQQTNLLPDATLQAVLQQQQQQHHLISALQNLHQQFASTIQSLQQLQQLQPVSDAHMQQQRTHPILASLLSNATSRTNGSTTSQADSFLGSLVAQAPSNTKTSNGTPAMPPQPTMGTANSLLFSLLSNQMPRTAIPSQPNNSQTQLTGAMGQLFSGGFVPSPRQQMQPHSHNLQGGNARPTILGAGNQGTALVSNVNTITRGQFVADGPGGNAAKRPCRSMENARKKPEF